jgi:deoxycytidine triphosphate deaminase
MIDSEIKQAIREEKIVMQNYSEDQVQPSSYDMRIGDRAILSGNEKEIDIKKEKGIIIRPGCFAIITTYENIRMPNDITGHIGVKSYYTRKGLILLAGLQIDPGFSGVLVLGMYNASPRKLTLDYLTPFCTIEFHKLSGPVERPYATSTEQKRGEIPRMDKDYLRTIETQSLSDLSESLRTLTVDVSSLTKTMNKFVVPILIGIAIAIGAAIVKAILGL